MFLFVVYARFWPDHEKWHNIKSALYENEYSHLFLLHFYITILANAQLLKSHISDMEIKWKYFDKERKMA